MFGVLGSGIMVCGLRSGFGVQGSGYICIYSLDQKQANATAQAFKLYLSSMPACAREDTLTKVGSIPHPATGTTKDYCRYITALLTPYSLNPKPYKPKP